MKTEFSEIENMLPGYFSGDISDEDRIVVDNWRNELPENELIFQENLKAWEAIPLLHEMEKFNSFDALKKVNQRISKKELSLVTIIQRIAAVLLIPLIGYTGFVLNENKKLKQTNVAIQYQTISSRQGMVTQFDLADGTKVWLNSGSSLQFPSSFTTDTRKVKLIGEAYFEVTKNPHQPFLVQTNDVNIEVLGTSFNVVSFKGEKRSEVVLVEGKVKLLSTDENDYKVIETMAPGQRTIYSQENQQLKNENVSVEKYIAWKNGDLIFQDDNMEEVVRRLSRWFNVEIVINDPEIKSYVYKAAFRNENLTQVLNLLKISAPIDYSVEGNKLLPNGEYSKLKVHLMKKKKI